MVSKRHFELDKELKDISKQRLDVENELRALDNEYKRESEENYESKMTIEKEKEFDALERKRHELDVKLMETLIAAKELERKEFEEARG